MLTPQNPAIAIYFTGLLVFCFNKRDKYCQVGIHSSTDDHELRIRLVKRGPDPESESERTLTIPHNLIRQSSDLWLDVEGEPSSEQQGAEPFIADKCDESATDPQDFRRVVDLEGEHFYNRPLKVRRNALKPILHITKGLLHTAALSSERYRTVPVTAVGVTVTGHSLGQVAEYVGVNFYLIHPNQALVLRAGRNGSELFRLKREEGVTYEITVDNGDTPQAPVGSDFHYYYDAIELNPGEPKIRLETYGLPLIKVGDTVCLAVWLSKSESL